MLRGQGISFADAMQTFEHSEASMHAQKWAVPRSAIAQIELQKGMAYLMWGDVARGAQLAASADGENITSADPVSQWWKRVDQVRALAPTGRAEEAVVIAREMLSLQEGWATVDLRYTYKLITLALVHARRYADAEKALAEYDARISTEGLAGQPQAPDDRAPVALEEIRILVALERGNIQAVLDMSARLPRLNAVHADEIAWLSRASALCQTGASDEGLQLFAQWLPRLATDRYEASPHVAYWRARMGLCALQAGHRKDALEAARLARAALTAQPSVSLHYKAPVEELERRLTRA
jgi:hypothetical protein